MDVTPFTEAFPSAPFPALRGLLVAGDVAAGEAELVAAVGERCRRRFRSARLVFWPRKRKARRFLFFFSEGSAELLRVVAAPAGVELPA